MGEKVGIGLVQLGKQGISENFIDGVRRMFNRHKNVKVSVLMNARPNGKADVQRYADEILEKLGKNYTAKTIGFVINLKKWRRDVREEQ